MTNRVTYAPQDFQKMCKQAERDHESKKLVVLMERVKRQIAERETQAPNGASRGCRRKCEDDESGFDDDAAAQSLGSV